MATCDNCGNTYDKTFEVRLDGQTHTFDCFECAINKLAPRCGHCGTRIIGHGVQAREQMFCCANCAQLAGEPRLQDRV